jgi:hypothetical protein
MIALMIGPAILWAADASAYDSSLAPWSGSCAQSGGLAPGCGGGRERDYDEPERRRPTEQELRQAQVENIKAMALAGDYAGARAAARRMQEDRPQDALWLVHELNQYVFYPAYQAYNAHRWSDAIDGFRAGIRDWPANAYAHLNLGLALMEQARLEDPQSARASLHEAADAFQASLENRGGLPADTQQMLADEVSSFGKRLGDQVADNDKKLLDIEYARQKAIQDQKDQVADRDIKSSIREFSLTAANQPPVQSGDLTFDPPAPTANTPPKPDVAQTNLIPPGAPPKLAPTYTAAKVHGEINKLAKVQSEITGVQVALGQMAKSNATSDEERAEWVERSNKAVTDAYISGAHATLDLLSARLQPQIKATDDELKRAEDQLYGELDPNRRESMQAAIGALKNRKDELERAAEGLEHADNAVDILEKTNEIAEGDHGEESKSALEAAWDACAKLGMLPEGASQAKALVDISYDITTQYLSLQHIKQLDTNSERYLNAVGGLQSRMEDLVKAKQVQVETIQRMTGPQAPITAESLDPARLAKP